MTEESPQEQKEEITVAKIIESYEDREKKLSEELKTYATFSNPVDTGILLYNGLRLALEKLAILEEKINKISEKLDGKSA